MKFQTMYTGANPDRPVIRLDATIVTRPGQALTVEETVVMFQQRGTVRQNRGYHFYDDTIATDTSKMTFEQLHHYSQQVAQHALKLAQAAQAKAHEDREAGIKAEVEKRFKAHQEEAAKAAAAQ